MRSLFIKMGLMCEWEETAIGYQGAGFCLLMGVLVGLFFMAAP